MPSAYIKPDKRSPMSTSETRLTYLVPTNIAEFCRRPSLFADVIVQLIANLLLLLSMYIITLNYEFKVYIRYLPYTSY